jgi:hypothetical protein
MRVVFDTNVVLDVLLERKPYLQDAATLFAAVPRMHTASSRATRKTSSEAGCASTPPQSLSPSFERFISSLTRSLRLSHDSGGYTSRLGRCQFRIRFKSACGCSAPP